MRGDQNNIEEDWKIFIGQYFVCGHDTHVTLLFLPKVLNSMKHVSTFPHINLFLKSIEWAK
jgi:hypothetical protein